LIEKPPLKKDFAMFKSALLAAVTVTVFVVGQPVFAEGPGRLARSFSGSTTMSFINAKTRTTAPFAHVRFCMDYPDQCQKGDGPAEMPLTPEREQELSQVNGQVNRAIRPVNDDAADNAGDVWSIDVGAGDCEDFALTKREHLLKLGWSPRTLRIAMARTGSGIGHAVLVVKTDQGDLVLDNRTNRIKGWHFTDLQILKIQSGDNPRQWLTL
jgi:predicted transglutaminase-like cysteine proteinase